MVDCGTQRLLRFRFRRFVYPNVHAWLFPIDLPHSATAAWHALLSAEERERARHFSFDRDRERFVVAHGVLRIILSGYEGMPPESLSFVAERGGKPRLTNDSGVFRFNLAHSNDYAAVVVAVGSDCGVDLEAIQGASSQEPVAALVFSSGENAWLRSCDPFQRAKAFCRIWTIKEAILKAGGAGISSMDRIDISSILSRAYGSHSLELPEGSIDLYELEPLPGFMAAIATLV